MVGRDLQYITEIANCGTIAKAADNLYITASALSKYVQTLENRYQIKIFDRIGKSFVLTYSGKRFLHYLKKQYIIQSEMESELSDISGSLKGLIRVGFPIGLCEFWLDNVLPEFHRLYPSNDIEVIEDISSNIFKMQTNNELDFSVFDIGEKYRNLECHNLIEETIVIAAPADDLRLKKLAVKKADHKYPWLPIEICNEYTFIQPFPDQNMAAQIRKIFNQYKLSTSSTISVRVISSILKCVANGLGITITADFAVNGNKNLDNISLYSFGNNPVTRSWGLTYKRDHYLSESALRLINMTIDQYRGRQ